MKFPEQPPEEPQRLSALEATKLLDTPPEERFDRVTRLAASLFDVPIALVSLVDRDRQWFKSCYGLGVRETGRDISFCGHAILKSEAFVVSDALADERFSDNPLVTGEPRIRFYAGAPLEDRSGFRIGTLCIIDRTPRTFSDDDQMKLRDLADILERELQFQELGNYYSERTRALNTLNEIVLEIKGDLDTAIPEALERANRFLGTDTAIVSEITGGTYTVLWHHERRNQTLANGLTLPLEQTYCSLLLEHGEVLAINHMGRSRFQTHPCYGAFGLESYLAAPIWIDEALIGTLNFSSQAPRRPPFTETEKMFVNLLARWVADAIHHSRQAATLEKLVANAPGMLYQYRLWPDGHSTFPYTSNGIQHIYNISAEDAARDASPVFSTIHPEDLPVVAESIKRSAKALSRWHQRYRIQWHGNAWHWVEGQANPEKLPDGSILWHGYIVDINERYEAEQMKNQFISTVSHELRTPLTSISGSLGLILGGAAGKVPEKTRGMLAIAKRNADHLKVLIDDLLDIEKLISGNMPLEARKQELEACVVSAIEEIQPYARLRRVSIHLNNLTPGLTAHYDKLRLKQALANLLSNAVKFSPEQGQVTVEIDAQGPEARIAVQDSGPGVPASFKPRIFQKFAQADASSSRSKEGTGLGLAITRELMLAMGGEIGFESKEGLGATFWVTLPRSEPPGTGA
ncbi:GAF domain-containing sensor histidine kinase [Marinobacter daepoensis]|uniref:GAF domain-containing sensor histidine kinase n=1 Tax=Marinobacter daepoensis TaxID=262077 RepID=UPI0003FBB74F|nr:GAF domain-containing sensor histidine kinase [Marinobacter daepoensis]